MQTPEHIVAAWSIMSPWRVGPAAPNGSVRGQLERRGATFTIYRADYYGKGPKLYMDITPLFQGRGQLAPFPQLGSSDGDVPHIRRVAAEFGIAV
ncbi:hypothetical protein LCGC14_1796260 [marine sediment metagenome]|uniref:Uncharacterized protein n=1 Tax=marine sediment metagenome TaxID=412755 RepID=A0A0F9GR30_9ZZZZ